MIGSVTIRVSAGRPNMPVGPVAVIQGSACTIGVLDVPRRRFGVEITRVAVSVCNGVGTTSNVPAKLECGVWTATFDASLFSQPGSVENGVKIFCGGKDENGVEREWTIGVGDVDILSAGEVPVPAPGESWQNVHLRDEEPEAPVKGDLFKFDDGWKIFDGEEWQSIGGGGGVAVSSVNGKTGAVVLTGSEIKTSETDTQTISAKLSAKQDTLSEAQKAVLDGGPYQKIGEFGWVEGEFVVGPTIDGHNGKIVVNGGDGAGSVIVNDSTGGEIKASIKKGGKEVATEDQLRVTMQLVGNDPYTVQVDGEELTFAEIKTYAQTRNAVIQRGQGTYRVTYIGANEMMWDVTGTVQGEVKTGQIHIFDQNGVTVVQRVEPKVLATKPMIDDIKSTVSTDNRFLVNDTTAAIQTRENEDAEWVDQIRVDKGYDALTGSIMVKLDKSVQTVTVAGSNLVIEIPDSVDGTVRDLCVYANNSSDADTALTFPAGTYYGDDPNGAVAKAGKVTAIYLTEIPKGAWMLRIEELEQHEVVA